MSVKIGEDSDTLLHFGARAKSFDIIDFLVKKGVNIYLTNAYAKAAKDCCATANFKAYFEYKEALHRNFIAIAMNNKTESEELSGVEMLQELLAAIDNNEIVDEEGNQVLHILLRSEDRKSVV